MDLRQKLLNKMEADRLAEKVRASLLSADGAGKPDLAAMQRLLEMSPYRHRRERDLDLYVLQSAEGEPEIVVLDGALARYRTQPEDVALRKSPTLREMISIRNAIRILNDADVLAGKREDTVDRVHRRVLDGIDLRFRESDLEALREEAETSFRLGEPGRVREFLSLFAALLSWPPLPGLSHVPGDAAWGLEGGAAGERRIGPAVCYRENPSTLLGWEDPLPAEKVGNALSRGGAALREDPVAQGVEVFHLLKQRVLDALRPDEKGYRAVP